MKSYTFSTTLILMLSLQLLSSCSNTKIESKIIKSLERNCPGDSCAFELNDLTEFDWEKVFIFDNWSTPEKITKVIGIEYKKNNHLLNESYKMIFVKGNEIVYEEDFGESEYNKPSIVIGYPIDTTSYSEYTGNYSNTNSYITKTQAIFHVRKIRINGSCKSCFKYELTPRLNIGKTLSY